LQKKTCEQIVIGSSLEAVVYSYLTNSIILSTDFKCPFEFDFLSKSIDISKLAIQNKSPVYKLKSGEIACFGVQKAVIWTRLLYALSLCGKMFYPGRIKTLIYNEDDGSVVIMGFKINDRILANKIVVFDPTQIQNLLYTKSQFESTTKVVDYSKFTKKAIKPDFNFWQMSSMVSNRNFFRGSMIISAFDTKRDFHPSFTKVKLRKFFREKCEIDCEIELVKREIIENKRFTNCKLKTSNKNIEFCNLNFVEILHSISKQESSPVVIKNELLGKKKLCKR